MCAMGEAVNHSKHYNSHPSLIECIQIVRHFGFNCGNVINYLWRAGLKDESKEIEDLERAMFDLRDVIDSIGYRRSARESPPPLPVPAKLVLRVVRIKGLLKAISVILINSSEMTFRRQLLRRRDYSCFSLGAGAMISDAGFTEPKCNVRPLGILFEETIVIPRLNKYATSSRDGGFAAVKSACELIEILLCRLFIA